MQLFAPFCWFFFKIISMHGAFGRILGMVGFLKKNVGKNVALKSKLFALFGSSTSHRWGEQVGASPKNHFEFELCGPYT